MVNNERKVRRIMIIAGEASGDIHGAKLASEIRKLRKDVFIFGIGGNHLRSAGVEILVPAEELSVVGISEVLSKAKGIARGLSIAKKALRSLRPDLLILIDFPDFNLHVAATAKALGIKILYFISPQIWAWRKGRVKRMKELIDQMAVILPFEEQFFRKFDIPVSFVGHPLLDQPESRYPKPADPSRNGFGLEKKVILGLLPGSRDGEIRRHLSVMLDSAVLLRNNHKNIQFLLSLADSIDSDEALRLMRNHPGKDLVKIVRGPVRSVFERSDILVAASGTVTLEAAIAGIPMVTIYKVSPSSYYLGRLLIKVPYISLVNLIFGRKIIPELIQDDASAENIAALVLKFVDHPGEWKNMRKHLSGIRNMLGGPGASVRVAGIAVRMIDEK